MGVAVLGAELQYTQVAIEAQGSLLAVASTRKYAGRLPTGNRGLVNEFSPASRLRMMRKVARLDVDSAVFITLTYGAEYPDARQAKAHLRALFERFRRRFPDSSGIWRLEFQKRGAPHFHIIMFDLPFISFATLKDWWASIIGVIDSHAPRVRIEMVRSKRGVMYYVSKYCAKFERNAPKSPVSLSSAHICTHFCKCTSEEAMSNAVYSSTHSSIGRFWGVFNGAKLPFAEHHYEYASVVTELCIPAIKQIMQQAYAELEPDYRGAVVFSDRAEELFRLMLSELIKDVTYG